MLYLLQLSKKKIQPLWDKRWSNCAWVTPLMEPKLQTPSLSHKDGLGALGNWHGGRTQSLIPNRHWDFSLLSSFRGPLQPSEVAIKGGLRHLFLSQNDLFLQLYPLHSVACAWSCWLWTSVKEYSLQPETDILAPSQCSASQALRVYNTFPFR